MKLLFPLIALLVIAADQFTKAWMQSTLSLGHSEPLIGPLRLTLVHNRGIAFGLPVAQGFVFLAVVLVLVLLLLLYRSRMLRGAAGYTALGLLVGGAIGNNLIDRLRFGYVVDFIDFGFWPVFNIADSAVTCGVILLAYSLLTTAGKPSKPTKS
jgi:signal peptidase II